jgi:acetylornithine deacetylase/succinyl-diaminopimelate desuccinylase-like protein
LPTADLQTPSTVRTSIADEISRATDRLIAMSRTLVATASPNPPGDVTLAADAAEALLRQIPGMQVTRVVSAPGIVNLVGRLAATRPGRRLVFNGHLDTFPVGEDMAWTVPPLGGVVRDGRLYGRGISDMKGGIAASLLAADVLAKHREAWRGEIVITLAGDEETMGRLGTRHLLDNFPEARGDAMISADVGSPMVLRFGEKGLFWAEIEAQGSPAHGAHVHKGVNAIDRLCEALALLRRAEQMLPDAPAAVVAAIDAAKVVSEPLSGAGESDVLKRVTVNVGTIEGGVSPNLVPAKAIAKVDIRVPVGLSTTDIETFITETLGGKDGIAVRVVQRYEPNYTDPSHEIVRIVANAAEEVLAARPVVNMRVGASDARHYRHEGIATVIFGPTPFNMGGPDENVLIDELVAVAKVHALAAFEFLA